MFGVVIKILGSLAVVFIFFSMIVVKNATSDEGGAEEDLFDDETKDDDSTKVFPPHMWKGIAVWLGVIYGVVNLIAIATTF